MKNGHRPMRRQKREVTSPEELRRILEKCQILRIGAMDEEGMFVVPVNYGFEWEDELLLYFHSAKEGRKADAFRKDPKCGLRAGLWLRGNHRRLRLQLFRSL